jgi:ubiquinone/menaquinone biosynthesis C-methylase UbiE
MNTDILNEQIAYYRAEAPEYDEVTEQIEELKGAYTRARELLQQLGPCEQVLELACGTGAWTQVLLPMAHDITAIDAAPEMLALARQKLGNARVSFQQADVFQWEPCQEYDLVFFANWLSHVLPKDLDAFLGKVSRAVRPGGHLGVLDQSAPFSEDREIMTEGEGGSLYARRSLRNGKAFTIVKVFYDVTLLQEMLAALGFEVALHQVSDLFFFLSARRL